MAVELTEVVTPDSLQVAADPLTDINHRGALGLSEAELWTTLLDSPRPSRRSGYWTKERISEWLDDNIHLMAVPSAYYGDEIGTTIKSDHE